MTPREYLRRYWVLGRHREPESFSEKLIPVLKLASVIIPVVFLIGLVVHGA